MYHEENNQAFGSKTTNLSNKLCIMNMLYIHVAAILHYRLYTLHFILATLFSCMLGKTKSCGSVSVNNCKLHNRSIHYSLIVWHGHEHCMNLVHLCKGLGAIYILAVYIAALLFGTGINAA